MGTASLVGRAIKRTLLPKGKRAFLFLLFLLAFFLAVATALLLKPFLTENASLLHAMPDTR